MFFCIIKLICRFVVASIFQMTKFRISKGKPRDTNGVSERYSYKRTVKYNSEKAKDIMKKFESCIQPCKTNQEASFPKLQEIQSLNDKDLRMCLRSIKKTSTFRKMIVIKSQQGISTRLDLTKWCCQDKGK